MNPDKIRPSIDAARILTDVLDTTVLGETNDINIFKTQDEEAT